MLELGAYAALGLGGFGIGLVLALLGNIASRVNREDPTVPRTYFLQLDVPSSPVVVKESASIPEERVKCPCGLELPEAAMKDHVTVSGHSKSPSTTSGTGKVWDLNEAVVETTSPDCYRCGKPVYGLKRMGKTIYVAHLGCTDKKKATEIETRESSGRNNLPIQSTSPRSRRCPLCRRLVMEMDGFTEMQSRTGRTIRFHKACVESIGS